jgi:hypothetical protein
LGINSATDSPAAVAGAGRDLTAELAVLRAKAERICAELAGLYRRMDDLQQEIHAHQRRI